MEVKEAILTRRSIRKFTDHYVTNGELKEILEAARYAPSWANTQVWHYIIIRDREVIRQITETYSENNPARPCSFNASALIVVCAEMKRSGFRKGEQSTKFAEWFMFDLGMAVQNISLRAHDMGLGTVVVGLFDHDKCNKIVETPEDTEVVAILPMGKVDEPLPKAPKRKELKEIVHLDTFKEHFAAIESVKN